MLVKAKNTQKKKAHVPMALPPNGSSHVKW
jgi:hypothetical protein